MRKREYVVQFARSCQENVFIYEYKFYSYDFDEMRT